MFEVILKAVGDCKESEKNPRTGYIVEETEDELRIIKELGKVRTTGVFSEVEKAKVNGKKLELYLICETEDGRRYYLGLEGSGTKIKVAKGNVAVGSFNVQVYREG